MAKQRNRRPTRRRDKKGGPGSGRRKPCPYCKDKIDRVDYKDIGLLKKLCTNQSKMFSRKRSGNCAAFQRASSAAETGGSRHLRLVTDANCNVVITKVNVTVATKGSFNNTITELQNQGYNRTDRKYLIFMQAASMCGIATVYQSSDQADSTNPNNRGPSFARVDGQCWAAEPLAHEMMHTLGSVLTSAPHATAVEVRTRVRAAVDDRAEGPFGVTDQHRPAVQDEREGPVAGRIGFECRAVEGLGHGPAGRRNASEGRHSGTAALVTRRRPLALVPTSPGPQPAPRPRGKGPVLSVHLVRRANCRGTATPARCGLPAGASHAVAIGTMRNPSFV